MDLNRPIHSKIGASSYSRWGVCPGSVQLAELCDPPKTNILAMKGTIAHEMSSFFLVNGYYPEPDELKSLLKDHEDDFDPLITVDNLENALPAVKKYVEYIALICENETKEFTHPDHKIIKKVEHAFDMGNLYPNLYGTADCVMYNTQYKRLRVIDYKHGSGVVVEVVNNEQLLYYALGALETLKYPCDQVMLTIVQPRAYHKDGPIRSWVIPSLNMIDFENELIAAAKETEKSNPKIVPGKHCIFCPAFSLCPEQKKAKEFKNATVYYPKIHGDPKDDFEPIHN